MKRISAVTRSFAALLGLLLVSSSASAFTTNVVSETPANSQAAVRTDFQEETLKRFDFRVQPLGLLFGIFGIAVDIGVSDYWAAGISLSQDTPRNGASQLTAWEYGAYGTVFLNGKRFTNSWFVRPGFYLTPITETTASGAQHTLNNYSVAAIVGHQWVLHEGLNTTFGVGLEMHQTGSSNFFRSGSGGITNPTTPGNEIQPVMELSVGWAI